MVDVDEERRCWESSKEVDQCGPGSLDEPMASPIFSPLPSFGSFVPAALKH